VVELLTTEAHLLACAARLGAATVAGASRAERAKLAARLPVISSAQLAEIRRLIRVGHDLSEPRPK